MAVAHIEPIAGVLRVLPDGAAYGDRFIWSATVRWLSATEIELCAAMTMGTPSVHRAVLEECRLMGIRRILVVRYPVGKDGPRKERWIEVPESPRRSADVPPDRE